MNLGRIPEGFAVTGAVSTDYDVAPAAWVLEKCLCLRHITMFNWMESGGEEASTLSCPRQKGEGSLCGLWNTHGPRSPGQGTAAAR